MKKTIASLAMLASAVSATTALAMPQPKDPSAPEPVVKTICMSTYSYNADKSIDLGGCDESPNNVAEKRKIMDNGCAEGQVALISIDDEIKIEACMPPGMAQL
jgi:hypothetical protein